MRGEGCREGGFEESSRAPGGPSNDSICSRGNSAFQFQGDGPYELIFYDNGRVYVFRGTAGTELHARAA